MIFVGFSEETKGYRLIDKNNPKQVNIARSVVFIETNMVNLTDYILQDGTIDDNLAMDNIVIDQYNEVQNESVNESENSEESDPNIVLYNESELESQNSESSSNDDYVSLSDDDNLDHQNIQGPNDNQPDLVENRYPKRIRKIKRDDDFKYSFLAVGPQDPKNYSEIRNRSDKKLWKNAMKEEMKSLIDNKTWELVERPPNKNIIQCKWVYKLKRGINDSKRYKARLVAKGFSQIPDRDYDQTFAPVIRLS